MAIINWYNPELMGQLAFTVEFDNQFVDADFSELVYGLIENADGLAHKRNEMMHSQRDAIIHLRQELAKLNTELAESYSAYAALRQEYCPAAPWPTVDDDEMITLDYDESTGEHHLGNADCLAPKTCLVCS